MAVNDLVGIGAARHLVDCKFQIPGDFSLTGFDDLDVGQYVVPSITSINQSPRISMRRAVEILLKTIAAPSTKEIRHHRPHPENPQIDRTANHR